jgi:NAD(P)H-hydrate epimerase
VTADEMARIDHWMTTEVGVSLLQMMENAGRATARLALERFLEGTAVGRVVTVLAGRGGNGGGALAAARDLLHWGASVEVFLATGPTDLRGAAARQLGILRWHEAPIRSVGDLVRATAPSLVIDGLVGYSLRGEVRGPAADAVDWAVSQPAPVLALDVPTGIDATTGEVRGRAVHASATLTLGLPKRGLLAERARPFVGELYLADIGIPPELFARLDPPRDAFGVFSAGDLIRIA